MIAVVGVVHSVCSSDGYSHAAGVVDDDKNTVWNFLNDDTPSLHDDYHQHPLSLFGADDDNSWWYQVNGIVGDVVDDSPDNFDNDLQKMME